MKKTLFVAFGSSSLLIFLVGLFWIYGYLQPATYKSELNEWFKAEPADIWAYITDVENLPSRRSDISKIEIIEKNKDGEPILWKEYPDLGGYLQFRVLESKPNQLWKITLEDASFSLRGTWTYELKIKIPGTMVRIQEDSILSSTIARGASALSGRDANLQKEMQMLRSRF